MKTRLGLSCRREHEFQHNFKKFSKNFFFFFPDFGIGAASKMRLSPRRERDFSFSLLEMKILLQKCKIAGKSHFRLSCRRELEIEEIFKRFSEKMSSVLSNPESSRIPRMEGGLRLCDEYEHLSENLKNFAEFH